MTPQLCFMRKWALRALVGFWQDPVLWWFLVGFVSGCVLKGSQCAVLQCWLILLGNVVLKTDVWLDFCCCVVSSFLFLTVVFLVFWSLRMGAGWWNLLHGGGVFRLQWAAHSVLKGCVANFVYVWLDLSFWLDLSVHYLVCRHSSWVVHPSCTRSFYVDYESWSRFGLGRFFQSSKPKDAWKTEVAGLVSRFHEFKEVNSKQ